MIGPNFDRMQTLAKPAALPFCTPKRPSLMFLKPNSVLLPNTYAFESEPMVKPTGFREYDARWLFNKEINLTLNSGSAKRS
jgi:hypothetical protein